ncbi:MAG: aspartate aminotransferase family protein [Rhodospirillaceae bacterium]
MISDVMPTYARTDIAFERGSGPYLYTAEGDCYLDFGSGIAVNSLGHCHPKLVSVLADQASKIWHCSNLYNIPLQEEVARLLVTNSFADTAFFCNSGAEAVEAGLKIVRKYQSTSGHPERYRVVTFNGSFHGRTLTTISAAANEAHKAGFGPMVDGFDLATFGDLQQTRSVITDKTAAILVEPIQGEGGIRPADGAFLAGLRDLCDEFGILLFFDEVQTGIGRTGYLFAHQAAGTDPDVMALAKGIGGGFPVGACLASERAASGMGPGTHGSTFGGNPLGMSVAKAVLEILLERGFLEHCKNMGALLTEGLNKIVMAYPELLAEVRGSGLMIGLKCLIPAGDLVDACRRQKLLTVPAGDNVVRLLPPLIIDKGHIEEALRMISGACQEINK